MKKLSLILIFVVAFSMLSLFGCEKSQSTTPTQSTADELSPTQETPDETAPSATSAVKGTIKPAGTVAYDQDISKVLVGDWMDDETQSFHSFDKDGYYYHDNEYFGVFMTDNDGYGNHILTIIDKKGNAVRWTAAFATADLFTIKDENGKNLTMHRM